MHPCWSVGQWCNLHGRVADLKAAYKQLPRHPAHASVSVVAVQDPSGSKVHFFQALSLMFGETAAVYGFLRFSRAIAAIACQIFKLVVVEFFDDFTQIDPEVTSESAQNTLEGLLDLLGWQVATTPEKRLPFGSSFVSLGVQLDLAKVEQSCVVLAHKPGRIANLKEQVERAVDKGLGFREALSIRGKV